MRIVKQIDMVLIYRLFLFFIACAVFNLHAASQNDDDITHAPVRYHPKHPGIPIPQEVIATGKVSVNAPIGDRNPNPIMRVFINGKGPFFFIFDSGWSNAMISRQAAERLNLPLVGSQQYKAKTPNQVVDVFNHLYLATEIKIDGVTIKNYALNASSGFEDDVELFKRKGINNEVGIDGVLGPNSFYGLIMTVDYQHEKIIFEQNSLSLEDKHVLPYGKKRAIPNIDLTIDFHKLKRKESQNFIVDTGSYKYIHVNACNIPEMKHFTQKDTILSYDFSGYSNSEYFARLYGDLIIFPDYAINSPYITFSSTHCSADPHGLLGRAFFEKHRVTIDQDDALIKIEKYK